MIGSLPREPTPDLWKALEGRLDQVCEHGTDVWATVATASDIARWRPRLASDVEVSHLDWARSGPKALLARGSDIVGLDERGRALVGSMDGTRSVGDLVESGLVSTGTVTPAVVVELVRLLWSRGFLADAPVDVDDAVTAALAYRAPWRSSGARTLRTLSVEWEGADKLVRWLYAHGLRLVSNRWGGAASLAVAIGGLVAFGFVEASHRFHLVTESAGWGFALLITLNLIVVFIHELGHGTAVVHHGRSIRSAGLRIHHGAPGFFLDAPQALLLDRRERMAHNFAGPWFEAVAGGLAAIILVMTSNGAAAPVLYRFVLVNYVVLVMNLVPLLELDGYWIISDALGVPDLRARSFAFARRQLWHKLARRQTFSRAELGLGIYAAAAIAFGVVSLVLTAYFWRVTFGGVIDLMWHAGPAGVIGLIVLALVLTGPVAQALVQAILGIASRLRSLWRQIRFRMQRRWRAEAVELLRSIDLLDELPPDVCRELEARVRLVEFGRYEAVVSQGDKPTTYFLVRRGRAVVVEEDPVSGSTSELRSLGPGDGFGEMALMRRSPRLASVRAVEPLELFAVDAGTFDRLLLPRIRFPRFAPSAGELAELGTIRCLAGLDLGALRDLLNGGEWIVAGPGEDLVVQGREGDGFYLLVEGQAEVVKDGQRVEVLRHGDHFGEIALLRGAPRNATVRALTPVRLFRVDSRVFARSLATLFSAPARNAITEPSRDSYS